MWGATVSYSQETIFRTPQEIAADIARMYREDASRWIQGWLARDAQGNDVYEYSPTAVCWCLRGAIDLRARDGGVLASETYQAFDDEIGGRTDPGNVAFVKWNDEPDRTIVDVINLCDKVARS